jgi:hypothetical protein
MCQCRIAANGDVITCDSCAAQIIDALNGLLPDDQEAQQQLPTTLTGGEYRGLQSAVNGWLDRLEEGATW